MANFPVNFVGVNCAVRKLIKRKSKRVGRTKIVAKT